MMQWATNCGNTQCNSSLVEAVNTVNTVNIEDELSLSSSSENASYEQVEQQETCPICLSCISKKENYTKTKCGHMFCFSCINTSLMSNHTCPMCRTNIEEEPRQNEKKKKTLNMEDGVNIITEEIEYFDIRNHITSAMYEIEQMSSLSMDEKIKKMGRRMKQMTRLYSMRLLQSFIAYEEEEEDEDEEEDEEGVETGFVIEIGGLEDEDDDDEPYETSDDDDDEED